MMDEKKRQLLKETGQIWAQAIEIAKADGLEKGLAHLQAHGLDSPDAAAAIGMALGTWQPVEYDEDGNVKTIWN